MADRRSKKTTLHRKLPIHMAVSWHFDIDIVLAKAFQIKKNREKSIHIGDKVMLEKVLGRHSMGHSC